MGFLSGIFDTGAKDAYRMNVANMEFIKGLYGKMGSKNPNKLFGAINNASGKAEGLMADAVGTTQRGYDQAQAIAGTIGSNAYQRILDRGVQAQAQARSNMASAGLSNTTGAANLANQVNYQTNQQLGGVDEGLASLRSGLAAQGGRAVAGAQQAQAQNLYRRPQMLGQAAGTLGGQLSSFEFAPGASLFQQLGGPIGDFIGSGGLGSLAGLFGGKKSSGYDLDALRRQATQQGGMPPIS